MTTFSKWCLAICLGLLLGEVISLHVFADEVVVDLDNGPVIETNFVSQEIPVIVSDDSVTLYEEIFSYFQ